MERTEIRSFKADSHLGHLFEDSNSATGERFCINSASLKFIPVDTLEKEGLGEYKKLFAKQDTAVPTPNRSKVDNKLTLPLIGHVFYFHQFTNCLMIKCQISIRRALVGNFVLSDDLSHSYDTYP